MSERTNSPTKKRLDYPLETEGSRLAWDEFLFSGVRWRAAFWSASSPLALACQDADLDPMRPVHPRRLLRALR